MKRISCLIVLLLSVVISANAQSATLVMLKAERNRIEYLERTNQKEKANLLKTEAQKIMQLTLNDFTDNYSRGPVFFFIDTNLQKVINKKFDGVILNNELKPVDFRAWEKRNDYIIVYYGFPQTEITKEGNAEEKRNVHRATYYVSEGIVILNNEFKRIPKQHIHYVYLRLKGKRVVRNRPLYNFSSRNFNLSYYEMGKALQKELGRKGLKLPVN